MFDSGLNVINPTDRIVRSGGSVVVGAAGQVTVTPKAGQNMVLASGQLVAPVGSAAAPSYTFAGDTGTGIYRSNTGEVSIATGGVQRVLANSNGVIVSSGFLALQIGSAAAPSLTFVGRTNTGIFSPAAQTVSLVTAGAERVQVDASGNVVVSNNPVASTAYINQPVGLQVIREGAGNYGLLLLGGNDTLAPGTTGGAIAFINRLITSGDQRLAAIYGVSGSSSASSPSGYLSLYTIYNGVIGERVRVNPSGAVTFYADAASGVSQINASGTAPLAFYTNGTQRWSINASGTLLAATDNAYDIGASGVNRPSNVYAAGAVVIGANPAATGAIRLANGAGVYARNSTNSADVNLIVLDASDVTKVQGQNGLVFNSGSGGGITINCQAGSMAMYGSNSGDILLIPQAGRALFLSNVCTITQGGGVQVGSPTGGDLGGGRINVSGGIYLNGTAYTNPDYVFEHYFTGAITKNADEPGAADYRGLARLADVRRFAREHWHLPGLSRDDDLFRRAAHTLEKVEEAYLYLFDHEARLVRLEELDRRLRAVEAVLACMAAGRGVA